MIRVKSLLLLSVFLLVTACGDNSPEQVTEQEKPKPANLSSDNWPREDYTDPEQWDQPRIQFYFKGKFGGRNELWSIKIDGSDLRKIMNGKELDAGVLPDGRTFRCCGKTVRSANLRYIAANMPIAGTSRSVVGKGFVDLKTKKMTVMAIGSGAPSYQFSSDSSKITFAGWPEDVNAKGLRYVYDIPSGQLTTYPSLNAYRFFVLPDDTILAFHGKSITLYTFDNKKIRDIAMPQGIDFINEQMVASGNGQFALINTDTNQRLFSFDGYKFKHIQIGKRFPPAARAMVNNQGQVYEEDAYRLYSHIPEKKLLINIKPVFDNNIRFDRSIIINEQPLLLPLNNKNMTHDK